MSRKTGRRRRLQLYERGNIKCPICLSAFKRDEVSAGKTVTLEHVPPKFINGRARCLTCKNCNADTGRIIDQAAAIARPPFKVTVNIMGKHGAFLLSDDGKAITTPFAQYSKQDIQNLENTKSKTFSMSLNIPNPDAVATSWLKAAYLAVFSLLGPTGGYDYVCGKALTTIRHQLVNPQNHGAIGKFVIDNPFNIPDKDIFLISQPVPCWLVKIEDKAIILPCNGDSSTSEPLNELNSFADMGGVSISGHASWKFQTFGTLHTIRVHLKGASEFDSLIGRTIGGNLPNGQTVKGTCIKHMGEDASLLCVNRVVT